MSDKYYREEYNYLIEQGSEFAKRHPQKAGMLRMTDNRSRDPNVEYLMQGFAFMSSRIRKKIEDDFPEMADGLLSLVWPDYMKPVPSFCLLEFRPQLWDLQEAVTVPAGAEIDSQSLEDGFRCRFRTCFPNTVFPVQLSQVSVDPMGSASKICFKFKLNETAALKSFANKPLKIQLFGEISNCWDIYSLLLGMTGQRSNVDKVELRVNDSTCGTHTDVLGPECLTPVGLSREEALLPAKDTALWSFGLMREYFAFPEKFLAFNLDVTNSLAKYESASDFEVTLFLNQPWPSGLRIEESLFRVNCVPVANLFKRDAEPVRLNRFHHQYKILGDLSGQNSYQVYSVESVEGVELNTGTRRKYQPLYTVRHQVSGEADKETGPFYSLARSESPWGGWDVFLNPVDPAGRLALPEEEVLSIELICSNGGRATRVAPGQLTEPVSSMSEDLRPTNLIHPTPPAWPRLEGGGMWRWLAHLSGNYLSLSSAKQLRSMLGLYDLSGNEANAQRVAGISNVSIKNIRKLIKGSLVTGSAVEVVLREENFSGQGDMFVFAYVLSSFMASYSSINSYVQLTVKLEPSNIRWTMPASYGQRGLL